MPRKQSPLKLERSPLIFVLAQFRFPAVLKMEKYVPDIQEALRDRGFPRYDRQEIQQVIFDASPKVERDTRWVFVSRDRRQAVVLASNFVVYETSDYDVFETFIEHFVPVLELIGSTVDVKFAEQVGLRYVDLIRPTADRPATDFLRENVRGLSRKDLGAKESRHQFVTQAQTEHGSLFVRSFDNTGPNVMPPDLASTKLDLQIDLDGLNDEPYRVLDIDHIAKAECDFTSSVLTEKLWGLHEYSSKAFLAAVTKEAVTLWEAKE